MSEGLISVGQLLREKNATYGVVTIGFGYQKDSAAGGKDLRSRMRKIKLTESVKGNGKTIFTFPAMVKLDYYYYIILEKNKTFSNIFLNEQLD